jgi:hypothetical protein
MINSQLSVEQSDRERQEVDRIHIYPVVERQNFLLRT